MKRLDARLAGHAREADRAAMVHVHGEVGIVLADRVVGELGEMHHRVEALEIGGRDLALILRDHLRMGAVVVEEPAAAVIAGVEPEHLMARLEQLRTHDRADIAVGSGKKNAHDKALML